MAKKQTANGGRSTSSTSKRTSKTSANTTDAKKATTASRASTSKATDTRKSAGRADNKSKAASTRSKAKSGSDSKQTSKAKPRTRVTKKRPNIAKRPSVFQRGFERVRAVFDIIKKPEFWRGLIQKLPPWIDEVGALLLIVLGVVMFTALLNTSSQGEFAQSVSNILRQLFGDGAYIFSLAVLGTGVIILLPKFGIVIEFAWPRIAAIEGTYGALLAILHLLANDPQPRALAQEGGGGGYVGWALTEVISSLGRAPSLIFFGLVFIVSVALTFRIRLYHLVAAFVWLRTLLQSGINRLDQMEFDSEDEYWDDQDDDGYGDEADSDYNYDRVRINPANGTSTRKKTPDNPAPPSNGLLRRPSVVQRDPVSQADSSPTTPPPTPTRQTVTARPSPANTLPPRQPEKPQPSAPQAQNKSAAESNPDTPPANPGTRPTKRSDTPKPAAMTPAAAAGNNGQAESAPERPLSKEEKKEIAEQTRRSIGAANGRSLVAPGEPGERESIVPRDFLPDARVVPAAPRARIRRQSEPASERYFTVDDFRESKKIGKRGDDLPPLTLLNDIELNKPTEEEINTNAKIIGNTLLEFDVEVEVIDVHVGPTVTQYAVSPYTETINDAGERVLNRVRVSEITNLGGDLALALSAKRLRIQAPVPGHSYVGIEVPNRQPSTVALRPVLESETFYKHRKKPLALPLGRDVSGEPFVADLATMPHLLIAGTTGSGKSIMLAAMTTSFVMNNTPDQMRLVLLDPKMVELSRFNGLPHLLGPVETELDRIVGVLRWATREMERRYKLLEKEAARNIETFNNALGRRRQDEALPYIVIIIDEIGDLMMQRPDETERTITRLAQMARAVGIHLMIATQRPSVDVITGLIKANFPARISFAVASSVDSRVILDSNGAESLMGRGDMLFLAPDAAGPQRIQGCYISDEEVNEVVEFWEQWNMDQYEEDDDIPATVAPWERGMTRREVLSETDPMLEDAITLVVAEGEASASMIQRRLGLGYPRAARIIDMMHELGIVGASRPGGRTREVLVKPGADPFKAIVDKRMKKKNH